jgi:hypothetical protein
MCATVRTTLETLNRQTIESMPSPHHEQLRALAARLRRDLPAMVDETEGLLHQEQPELLRRIGPVTAREAIGFSHERFVRLVEGAAPDERARHVAFGAAAAVAGVEVQALLAAYRVGAEVGWRHATAHVAASAIPGPVVIELASRAMAYTNEIAADSFAGFARAATAAQGARARRRQGLLDAVLGGRHADVEALAAAAGWPLPRRLRVGVLLGGSARLDEHVVLVGVSDGAAVAVASEGAEAALLHADVPLAVGPLLPQAQAPLSLARARRVAALAYAGVLPDDRTLTWETHLATLVVHADDAAASALVLRRLAPLLAAPARRQALLRETLTAWLRHPGRPREIARVLHLHHQTVRYRLARLRDHFGEELDDPDARFELALALRAERSSHARTAG